MSSQSRSQMKNNLSEQHRMQLVSSSFLAFERAHFSRSISSIKIPTHSSFCRCVTNLILNNQIWLAHSSDAFMNSCQVGHIGALVTLYRGPLVLRYIVCSLGDFMSVSVNTSEPWDVMIIECVLIYVGRKLRTWATALSVEAKYI